MTVGYTMDAMVLDWLSNANTIEFDDGVILPGVSLVKNILYDCSMNYTSGYLSIYLFVCLFVCLFIYFSG